MKADLSVQQTKAEESASYLIQFVKDNTILDSDIRGDREYGRDHGVIETLEKLLNLIQKEY